MCHHYVRWGADLEEAVARACAGKVEAAAAVAHMAAQGGPLGPTLLALELAPPPNCIRHPLQLPL